MDDDDVAAERFIAQLKPVPLSTPESIKRGREIVDAAECRARRSVLARIDSRELISQEKLEQARGPVQVDQLFAYSGPGGVRYYPAYVADPELDLDDLVRVSAVLAQLPAASQDGYLTSERMDLGATPLQALRAGRYGEVLVSAAEFAAR